MSFLFIYYFIYYLFHININSVKMRKDTQK